MYMFHKIRVKLSLYIFVLSFLTFNRPSICTILNVREGEEAKLNFSYPCDITKTKLQQSHRAPFYSSDKSNHLPPRYELDEKNDTGQVCFILLIIDPVSRNDEGTYILSVYNHSQLLPEYPIGLRVAYPPGKASCESSSNHLDGAWIKLQCNAPLGNLPGQIVCYQNGVRLPHLGTPVENGGRLSQAILARIANHFVHCCSSTFDETKTMQQCMDYGWDPIQNIALTDITDPSTPGSPTQHSKSSKNITLEASRPQMITDMASNRNVNTKTHLYIVICFMGLPIVIFIFLYFIKVKENRLLKKKSNTTNSSNEQNIPTNEEDTTTTPLF